MATKTQVKDSVSGQTLPMWEVDAEEAVRYAPARFTIQQAKPIPAKNPGGRGY